MSRTTLGYFIPPLTQEEKETVIDALIKITTKVLNKAAFDRLVKQCEAVANDKMGDVLDGRLIFRINEQMANQVREWASIHPEAPELANQKLYWVEFSQMGEHSYGFNYSPAILEMVRGNSTVLAAKVSDFNRPETDLCHMINHHIHLQNDTVLDTLPKKILKAEEEVLRTFNRELCDKIEEGFIGVPYLQLDQSDFLIRFAKAFQAASNGDKSN